jgi:hypothetical protein
MGVARIFLPEILTLNQYANEPSNWHVAADSSPLVWRELWATSGFDAQVQNNAVDHLGHWV